MPDSKRFESTLGFLSTLALLALLLAASIRLSGFVTVSDGPDRLHSSLTVPPDQPSTYFSAATATDAIPRLKALASENEEEEGADALVEAPVSYRSLLSFGEVSERQLIVPRSTLSHYPLRC